MKADVWYDVYLLIDPFTMEVFYVGVAEDMFQRYLQHISGKDENEQKNQRLAAIKEHGSLPIVHRVMCAQGDSALFWEALYTEVFLLCKQPLTNRTMKVNTRKPDYIELRDGLVVCYQQLSKGFTYADFLSASIQPLTQETQARIQQIAVEHDYTFASTEKADLYGTHQGFTLTPKIGA